jgi:putative ABC transport system permease protein
LPDKNFFGNTDLKLQQIYSLSYMRQLIQIAFTSFKMAFQELKVNKLRTFLSLLGVTIGIFCIVAVSTVLDSLEKNIRTNVATLGNDVIYISKWPWTDEGGEYKWWEYWRRPVPKVSDLKAIERQAQTVRYATLCYSENDITAKQNKNELTGITGYAVTTNFEKMQNFEIASGRYFSPSEINGGNNLVVLGYDVARELFPGINNIVGMPVTFIGRKYNVIGVLKKNGDNMAGFNFDRGLIFSYFSASSIKDVTSLNADNTLMAKAKEGLGDDIGYETEGILRAQHRIQPGAKNDFSINKLSQITEQLDTMFAMIDLVGIVIAFFSLLVGGFGIANIMFVSVKERTKIIGLKKAIGAKKVAILTEFLVESITLCLIGGLIGIAIVVMLSLFLTYVMNFTVTLSVRNFLTGISISTFVGVLAGYIPARSAARMDPVVAIRSN